VRCVDGGQWSASHLLAWRGGGAVTLARLRLPEDADAEASARKEAGDVTADDMAAARIDRRGCVRGVEVRLRPERGGSGSAV
jgi:hypothetical protein